MRTIVKLHRLAALGLLALAALPVRGDAVADARTALVAGEFAAAKTLLDPVLIATPTHAEAAFLRAVARVGLAVETRLPQYATKLGAVSTDIDIGDDAFDITFKPLLAYDDAPALGLVNNAYRVPPVFEGPAPAISFENRGSAPRALVLAAQFGSVQNQPLSIGIRLDGESVGHLFAGPSGVDAWGSEDVVSYDFQNQRFTLTIPAGSAATLDFYQAPSDAGFSLVGTRPASLVVLNGKRVDEARPRLARDANFAWILSFLAQIDAETLGPVVDDLAVAGTDFTLTFFADETGSAQDIVVAYPDTQLLLAEIKTLQALRRLLNSYQFSQAIAPVLFSDAGPAPLFRNAAFLAPRTASAALNAERASARTLLLQALAHYANASDAGLWTRDDPASGAYLFAIDDEDPVALETARLDLETALAQLDTALAGTVPLAELSDEFATDLSLPDDAGLSLAPLFGAPAVNLRGILPTIGEDGIVRGTSGKLLASGLLPGVGTAWWEQKLLADGLADLGVAARQTGPVIQRQPATLTTVAEGDDAVLAIAAECYPAPTYQWFKRVGSVYQPVEGAFKATLTIPAASRDDAGVYLCKVTNARLIPPRTSPTTVTLASRPATLVVTYPPEIVTPPAGLSRYTGRKVALTVAAVGVPSVRYQWFKGATAVTPVRAAPGLVFTASAARAGDYHVVVTNAAGSVASDPVAVDVQTKPVFTTHPVARTVAVGASVTFTAAAAGNPAPSIKWRKNGRDIPGATGPTYTIAQAALADRGVYTAVAFATVQTGPATTAVATTVSAGARLTVTP